MRKILQLALCILSLFMLANYSSEDSELGPKKKQRVNFYGKLIDSQGQEIKVDNISISGIYKQIQFYIKPESPDVNPDVNITKIDLSETKKILRKSPDLVKFKNRDYVEITIISNDAQETKNNYIIESSKKIWCDQMNPAGSIEKEVKFQGIKELIIDGYKSRETEENKKLESSKKDEMELLKTTTTRLIDDIEESSKKIEEPTIKKQILSHLNDLKETIKQFFE